MKRLSRFMFFVIVMWIITFPLPVTAQDVLPSNETIVMNYLDLVYHQGAVSAAVPLLTGDAIIHDPVAETYGITGLMTHVDGLRERVATLNVTPYAVISEGDMVVVPYVWQGMTPTDSPNGLSTPVSGNAVEFFRFDHGKIAEIWRQSEWHDFSILGSEEDYRGQINMLALGSTAMLVETTGIPMLTDALPVVSLVETTGIPALADFPEFEADTPVNPVFANTLPTFVETTGIPALADVLPAVSLVETTGIPAPPIAEVLREQMPSLVSDETVVLRWLESFNQGQINRELMLPEFKFHTCPCDDGIGTMDYSAFVESYERAISERVVQPWTPLVHDQGFTMASEGGLTALLFDEHFGSPFSHAEGVAIFRVENGLLAEAWQF